VSTNVQATDPAAPSVRQFTLRAVLTGMCLGALLTPCNIYSGLKIGWSFNMSITAALLSFAFWKMLEKTAGAPHWGLLENNINQTTASSAASIISAGLVAPIPALTMLTGQTLSFPVLTVWVFAVSIVGVTVAVGLRRQFLLVENLAFPAGVATAETIREIYGRGGEAMARVKVLLGAGGVAASLKLFSDFVMTVPKAGLNIVFPAGGALASGGVSGVSLKNLGFVLDPSLLMVGFGAIIGLRAGVSLLLGAVLAWGVLGPWALAEGWALPGEASADAFWFGPMVEWLLWPGVTLMVTASLTSFALSGRTAVASLPGMGKVMAKEDAETEQPGQVPAGWFRNGLLIAGAIAVAAQMIIFGIAAHVAIFAVLLTFLLAVVAGRVSGETGITPIGAMGKITQLTFGVVSPGNVTNNLMAANVTGGAAGQCADLLHDFKTGLLVGAWPRLQAAAQCFGVLTGAVAGSAAYLVLVPDPAGMLITAEWPAPAVATWKAVAEVFRDGWQALPFASRPAMVIAFIAGLAFALAEKRAPERVRKFVPSAPAIGLAFVIPAWNSLSMFIGAVLGALLGVFFKRWTTRFLLAMAAGLIAGESLAGVAGALTGFVAGG
jgi:OPT family oligopeptide transporter